MEELSWEPEERLLLVDGSNQIIRAFYGMSRGLYSTDGTHVHGVFGFLRVLWSVCKKYQIDRVICSYDVCKSKHRVEMFPEYKAQRKAQDTRTQEEKEDFYAQIDLSRDLLHALGIPIVTVPEHEADDVLGTLARHYQEDYKVYILSSDMDMTQLINSQVFMIKPQKKGDKVYSEKVFVEEYGFLPPLMVDLKSLTGDSSDNIPGITRVGDKTGIKLLKQYGSALGVLDSVEELSGTLKDNVQKDAPIVRRNLELVKILTDLPINHDDYELKPIDFYSESAREFYRKYNFESFLTK